MIVDLPASAESTATLQHGLQRTGWSIDQFWIAAIGIGGGFHYYDVQDIASGERAATPAEHDILASALNDYFVDRGQDHPVTLWQDLLSVH
jgi:hypothetical protein